jgi:transposase
LAKTPRKFRKRRSHWSRAPDGARLRSRAINSKGAALNEFHPSDESWARISARAPDVESDLGREICSFVEEADNPYLTDERWALIASHVPGKAGDPGCRGRDNRLFIEAVLWLARTGKPWRALPPCFGKWYTSYTRFRRWSIRNVWQGLFARLAEDGPCEYFFEDGAIRHAPLRAVLACEAGALEASPVQDEGRAA